MLAESWSSYVFMYGKRTKVDRSIGAVCDIISSLARLYDLNKIKWKKMVFLKKLSRDISVYVCVGVCERERERELLRI